MFDDREKAMILAGLAMADVGLPSIFLGIASDGGKLEPLGSAEISELIAKIQHGPWLAPAPVWPEAAIDRFTNFYECLACDTDWEETADSMCNDRCPKCNRETEPSVSEEIGEA
jgi:hypothetical protein